MNTDMAVKFDDDKDELQSFRLLLYKMFGSYRP